MARIIATAPLSVAERLRCAAVTTFALIGRAPELMPIFAAEVKDAARTIIHRPTG
jgi:hypothetical protein